MFAAKFTVGHVIQNKASDLLSFMTVFCTRMKMSKGIESFKILPFFNHNHSGILKVYHIFLVTRPKAYSLPPAN